MAGSSLPRRAFLRGVGAAGLLPLVEASPMLEALSAEGKTLTANLICGGPNNHAFEFARQRLAKVMDDLGGIRTAVASNYDDGAAIETGDLLVSYTSQVPVDAARCNAIRRYLEKGGRWFALHASNSVRDNKILPGILGSRFLAHPPYGHFAVRVAKPSDPLLAGITAFDVDDELYVIEPHGDIDVLLHARWGGTAMGQSFEERMQPLMYRHRVGQGGVLYLALGHAAPRDATQRASWELPIYQQLVRRGIEWAAKRREP